MISSPADLGFDGSDYDLPPLTITSVVIETEQKDSLFAEPVQGLSAARESLRESMKDRVNMCAEWVNSLDEPVLIWGEMNAETDMLANLISDSVQVKGADKQEVKEDRLLGFASGKYKKLVSKSSIAGFGMNYQHACKMAFSGPSYSFEKVYQAIRREWRFGQTKPVEVRIFMTDKEKGIYDVMLRKMDQDKHMRAQMIKVMSDSMKKEIVGSKANKTDYNPAVKASIPSFV